MPRLHGFHRFLPHLWELFVWLFRGAGLSETPQRRPVYTAGSSPIGAGDGPARVISTLALAARSVRKIGTTPIFASLYRSYSTDTDGASDTTHNGRLAVPLVAPPPCTL